MDRELIFRILNKAIAYNKGDADRIQHLTKVHSYAGLIAKGEGVTGQELTVLELAAILHDIGIHESERLYHDADGKHQEELGPDVARELLEGADLSQDMLDEICFLIGHHHTYAPVETRNHRILIEADFLVNIYEWGEKEPAIQNVYDMHFKTDTGKRLYEYMYL